MSLTNQINAIVRNIEFDFNLCSDFYFSAGVMRECFREASADTMSDMSVHCLCANRDTELLFLYPVLSSGEWQCLSVQGCPSLNIALFLQLLEKSSQIASVQGLATDKPASSGTVLLAECRKR